MKRLMFLNLLLIAFLGLALPANAGETLYPIKQDGKEGYIDERGQIRISPQFESAWPFSEGLARVGLHGKYGFVNLRGELVIQPRFDLASGAGFREGLVAVELNGQWGYVDQSGKMVIPPQFASAGTFSEGLAAVGNWQFKYGFIDRQGNLVIQPSYEAAGVFSEGKAAVGVARRFGYIDRTGKMVIRPQFQRAGTFRNGRATVRKGGKFGCIDLHGDLVIPARFEALGEFYDGLALAQIGGKLGYIDQEGKMVIKPRYYDAGPFFSGLAKVSLKPGGAYGYIDRGGRMVIPFKFEMGGEFAGNLAEVLWQGKWGYIDRTGRIIWPDTQNPKTGTIIQQPSEIAIWKSYRNDQYGFSFEYPVVYDEEANRKNCGVHPSANLSDPRLGQIKFQVQVGLQIYLFVLDSGGSSLGGFVNRFVKARENVDWFLQSEQDISVQGVKGKKIEFRFGRVQRYGTVTFLKRGGSIFLLVFTAGATCDFQERGIEEFEAYEHMIKTFKFHSGAVEPPA